MPPKTKVTIACTPVDANRQLEAWGNPFRYSPGIDYTLIECERCSTGMWIGPRQMAAYKANPDGVERLCSVCAVKENPGAGVTMLNPVDSPRRIT